MRFCPYAQRALLVAEAKNIQYDVVNCNLKQKPEFLLEKNPLGKVPTTEDSNGILYESLIVCDYIDENYSGRKLNSAIPYQKGLDRIWVELFNKVITLYYKSLELIGREAVDPKEARLMLTDLTTSLIGFEKELSKRGTQFYGGSTSPGMLDYMIWPWMERLPNVNHFYKKIDLSLGDLSIIIPNLAKWIVAMKKDKAVMATIIEDSVHFQYRKTYITGSPYYDLLEQSNEVSTVSSLLNLAQYCL